MSAKGAITVDLPGGTLRLISRFEQVAHRKVARAAEKRLRVGWRVLIESTPVWSGNTMANYRISVGEAGNDYTPFNKEGSTDKGFAGIDRSIPEAMAEQELEDAIQKIYANPYKAVYIYNNVRYDNGEGIEALEYGRVGRQAYGMFARAGAAMEATDVQGV